MAQTSPSKISHSGLADKVAVGFIWMLTQTFITKSIQFVAQLALAALLAKSDFGLIGMAMSVRAFTSFFDQGGLRVVLVQRGPRIDQWQTPAFWMALVFGLVGALFTAALAPLVAWSVGRPEIAPLILILAIVSPINALEMISSARLQFELRFQALATLVMLQAGVTAGLSILLAYIGWGPYAFIVPIPIGFGVRTAGSYLLTRPAIKKRWHPRRWIYLLSDSILLIGSTFMTSVQGYGANLVLGFFFTDAMIGIFFFGTQVVQQITMLLTQGLFQVLFPTLSQFRGDQKRQMKAFLRATRAQALVAVPGILMLGACAKPLLQAIFDDKWLASVPVMQILSCAVAIRLVSSPGLILLNSQGRYKTQFIYQTIASATFVGAIIIGAVFGNVTVVAFAILIWSCAIPPVRLYLALPPSHHRLSQMIRLHAESLIPVMPIFFAAMMAVNLLGKNWPYRNIILLIIIPIFIFVAHVLVSRVTNRETFEDIATRVKMFSGRLQRPQ